MRLVRLPIGSKLPVELAAIEVEGRRRVCVVEVLTESSVEVEAGDVLARINDDHNEASFLRALEKRPLLLEFHEDPQCASAVVDLNARRANMDLSCVRALVAGAILGKKWANERKFRPQRVFVSRDLRRLCWTEPKVAKTFSVPLVYCVVLDNASPGRRRFFSVRVDEAGLAPTEFSRLEEKQLDFAELGSSFADAFGADSPALAADKWLDALKACCDRASTDVVAISAEASNDWRISPSPLLDDDEEGAPILPVPPPRDEIAEAAMVADRSEAALAALEATCVASRCGHATFSSRPAGASAPTQRRKR